VALYKRDTLSWAHWLKTLFQVHRRWISGGSQFKTILGKKFSRSNFNQKLGVVVHTCHPSYQRSINRKTVVQATLGIT
jgi:hypothetical protein